MKNTLLATTILGFAFAAPVFADDIEQGLKDALEAYQEGEIDETRDILAFVTGQLEALKVDALSSFLPEAPDGWTRSEGDSGSMAAMGMLGLGGGQIASASYSSDAGTVDVTISVDNPMVGMLGTMISNPAMLGGQGEVRRVKRQNILLTESDGLQSIIENRILIGINGSNDPDLLISFFELIDISGLKDF